MPQLEVDQLGKIQVAWSSLNRKRESIGKVTGPQPIPASVNYDLWLGPAPQAELIRKQLHYDWHWDWATGTGEHGNNGIYPLNQSSRLLPHYNFHIELWNRPVNDSERQV